MKIIRIVAFAFVLALQLQGANEYHVQLRIEMGDGGTNDEVYSLISRELRQLGDVEGAKAFAPHTVRNYIMFISGFRTHSVADNYANGYALSVIIMRPIPLSENETERLSQQMYGDTPLEYLTSNLYIAGNSSLESTCKAIVAKFDATSMDSLRQLVNSVVGASKDGVGLEQLRKDVGSRAVDAALAKR